MKRPRALAVTLAAALVMVIGPLAASADDDRPIRQKMKFTESADHLLLTTKINKLFDSAAYEALSSGFESTILIRIWVYPKGSAEPIAFEALQRKVIYDMWDEVYEVQLDGPGGREKHKVKHQAEALKLLTSIDAMEIASIADVPLKKHHHVMLVAELNPVSDETLAEVRRWLTKGAGGGLDRGGGFFGSFVSVFVNPKIAEADRVLRLRSQPFYRPE